MWARLVVFGALAVSTVGGWVVLLLWDRWNKKGNKS